MKMDKVYLKGNIDHSKLTNPLFFQMPYNRLFARAG